MRIISEDGKMDDELEALQQRRKEEIEKLEKDLTLMEAQRAAFETEDLNKEKATVLRDSIDGARNALSRYLEGYLRTKDACTVLGTFEDSPMTSISSSVFGT
jgi:hypothetical protein